MENKSLDEIRIDLESLLVKINSDILPLQISENLLRIYYLDKSLLDIKMDLDEDYILEDYLGNIMVSNIDNLYKDIEQMLLSLNFIKEGFIMEGKRRKSMKVKNGSKPLYEELLDIDFDEFDEVIAREVIAKKTEEEDYSDIMVDYPEDDGYLNIDSLDELEDDVEPDQELEEVTDGGPEDIGESTEMEEIEECDSIEQEIEECSTATKSITQMYESQRIRQRNKIVEALLVDDAVENIERSLKSTLDSHGISAAQRVVVLGLILDRMLHATDDDIQTPEYLNDMILDVVDDKDIAELINKTVEKVLSGDTEPQVTDFVNDVKVDLITADGIEEITAETEESK